MKHSQIPNEVYQERTALLDRIKYYELSARHFDDDWRVGMVDVVEHLAYAKARLDHIDTVIASSAK